MPTDVTNALRDHGEQQRRQLPRPAAAALPRAEGLLPDWRVPRSTVDLGPALTEWLDEQYAVLSDGDAVVFSRALVASLGADLPARLRDRPVSADVDALVPRALEQLLTFLQGEPADYRLGRDHFLKDLRLVAGLTVPAGALVVDLRSRMSRRQSLALARERPSISGLARLARGRPLGPWLQPHIDDRYLAEGDEQGYDRSYRRIASLLEVSPEVWGMHGTSWLYDPRLADVSPRLTHFRVRLLERGGVLLESPTSDFDIASAISKSTRRRTLHEQGLYTPRAYSIAWLRDDMLAWAAS